MKSGKVIGIKALTGLIDSSKTPRGAWFLWWFKKTHPRGCCVFMADHGPTPHPASSDTDMGVAHDPRKGGLEPALRLND